MSRKRIRAEGVNNRKRGKRPKGEEGKV